MPDQNETGAHPPTFTTTYQWADGDHIGDYGWMTEPDQFDAEMEDHETPRDVLIERWERTGYEVRTLFPPLVTCDVEDQEPCEEDAAQWERHESGWWQTCERHKGAATPPSWWIGGRPHLDSSGSVDTPQETT